MRLLPFLPTAMAVAAICLGASLPAFARDARCRIEENRRVVFEGICDFTPDGRQAPSDCRRVAAARDRSTGRSCRSASG